MAESKSVALVRHLFSIVVGSIVGLTDNIDPTFRSMKGYITSLRAMTSPERKALDLVTDPIPLNWTDRMLSATTLLNGKIEERRQVQKDTPKTDIHASLVHNTQTN